MPIGLPYRPLRQMRADLPVSAPSQRSKRRRLLQYSFGNADANAAASIRRRPQRPGLTQISSERGGDRAGVPGGSDLTVLNLIGCRSPLVAVVRRMSLWSQHAAGEVSASAARCATRLGLTTSTTAPRGLFNWVEDAKMAA